MENDRWTEAWSFTHCGICERNLFPSENVRIYKDRMLCTKCALDPDVIRQIDEEDELDFELFTDELDNRISSAICNAASKLKPDKE